MDADARTEALFKAATKLADRAKNAALQNAMTYVSRSEAVVLAAAQITATATLFAALVEADLAEQIRSAREQVNAG